MTKEEIYDEQIAPLMSQIIDICKQHKIANVCSFSLDRDEGVLCTTAMVAEEFDPPEEFERIFTSLYGNRPSPLQMTVRDADGTIKEVHTIVAE